jgi:hypothetical protein
MFQRIVTNVYEAIINARMLSWLLTSLILTGFVYYVAPHQLETTAYKLSLITTAAWPTVCTHLFHMRKQLDFAIIHPRWMLAKSFNPLSIVIGPGLRSLL